MTQEQLRMQLLSGVITESEYKSKVEEIEMPLKENATESEKEFVEVAIRYVKDLHDKGRFGAGVEAYIDDIIESIVFMVGYQDKKSAKKLKRILGYNPMK
jgi:hypothetical protein